jgi:hypothetical protein
MAEHLDRALATDRRPQTSSIPRLRAEAAGYHADPFLLTVTADGEPHCSPVPVEWADDRVIVPAPGHWSHPSQPGATRPLSLLYPPSSAGGYALIINGTTDDVGPRLAVSITRAVLHRRASPPDAGDAGCGSDCIPLINQQ